MDADYTRVFPVLNHISLTVGASKILQYLLNDKDKVNLDCKTHHLSKFILNSFWTGIKTIYVPT